MSLSRQGGRRSWRVLSQLRQGSSSSRHLPSSAHLELQNFRLHGFTISSSSCLHHFNFSPSFSTAAEAAHVANSANSEPIPPFDSVSEKQEAPPSAAMDSEQEESGLKTIIEEQKELVSSLRAELEIQKTLTRTILDEIRVLKLSADAQTVEGTQSKNVDAKQPCLKWTAFMEHLQSLKFFEDENEESSSDIGSVFDDPVCVRRAIYMFSRAHESVFEYLSPIDLRILARHGSSADDTKASAAQKRLRQFFHLGDLPTDSGAAKAASTQPSLSDVTRLLYSTVLEATYGDDVESSISHLLREIVILSKRPSVVPVGPPLPAAETSLSSKLGATFSAVYNGQSKQDKEHALKKKEGKDIRKISTAKQEEPLKAAARAEPRPGTSVGVPEWKCPRCSFVNLDTKHRCVECSRRRPQRTYGSDKGKTSENVCLIEEDSDAKGPAEGRQAKAANKKKGDLTSSTQGHEILKDRSSFLAIQEHDTAASRSEPETGSEGSETFSVLDGILDSEDSCDELQEEGKLAGGPLDDSEEGQQGDREKASLSSLFPKVWQKSPSRRSVQRDSEQRNGRQGVDRPLRKKRFEDDDDNGRSRHGSVGEDLGDKDPMPRRSGRGFYDDHSRNRGRGGYNSFSERGGGPRGGAGSRRDDVFESRQNDGGRRGRSAYGERNRGGRSSSWNNR